MDAAGVLQAHAGEELYYIRVFVPLGKEAFVIKGVALLLAAIVIHLEASLRRFGQPTDNPVRAGRNQPRFAVVGSIKALRYYNGKLSEYIPQEGITDVLVLYNTTTFTRQL